MALTARMIRDAEEEAKLLSEPPPLSLLARIGRVIDWPGRQVRSALIGKRDATGWDVLRKLGIRDRPGPDPVDLLAFGTEVALDPLTFIGGGLTKAGRAAGAVRKAADTAGETAALLKAGKGFNPAQAQMLKSLSDDAAETIARFPGVEPLELTKAAQAASGNRAFLQARIPFTDAGVPLLPRAVSEKAYAGLGRLGDYVQGTAPAQSLIRRFGSPHKWGAEPVSGRMFRFSPAEETRREISRAMKQGTRMEQAAVQQGLRRLIPEGTDPDELIRAQENVAQAPDALRPAAEYARDVREGLLGREEPMKLTSRLESGRIDAARGEPTVLDYVERMTTPGGRRAVRGELEVRGLLDPKKAGEFEDEAAAILSQAAPAPGARVGRLATTAEAQRDMAKRQMELFQRDAAGGAGEVYGALENQERALRGNLRQRQAALGARGEGVPFPYGIRRELRGDMADAMEKLFRKHGIDVFEKDPTLSLPRRVGESGDAIRRINEIKATIERHATPTGEVDLLELAQKIMGAGGRPLSQAELRALVPEGSVVKSAGYEGARGFRVPKEVARGLLSELQAAGDFVSRSEFRREVTNTIGAITAWQRAGLTQLFPAFHFRNLLTNVQMATVAGAKPIHWGEAFVALRDPEQVKYFQQLGLINRHATRVELGQELAKGYVKAPTQTKVGKKVLDTVGKYVSDPIENWGRVAIYKAAKKRGLSDLAAVEEAKKYLFDYSELTSFEKRFMRDHLFLFYTFTRKMLPLLATQAMEKTGEIAMLMRAASQPSLERGAVPEYLNETAAIPFGRDQAGNPSFITGLGIPVEELSKFDTSGAEPGKTAAATRLLEKAAAQMSPIFRMPLERLRGKDFFLNRPILESDRAYPWMKDMPESLKWLADFKETQTERGPQYRADPDVLWWLRNSPVSRLLNTAGKLTDPRRSLGDKAANFLTGVRTVGVSPDQEARAAREMIERQLLEKMGEGKARQFRGFFATGRGNEELGIPDLRDPETMALLERLRLLREKL